MKNECFQTSEDSRRLSYGRAPILSAVLCFSVLYEVIVVLEIILNVSEHICRIMITSHHQKQNSTSVIQPRTCLMKLFWINVPAMCSSFFPGIPLRILASKVLHKTAKLIEVRLKNEG